MKLIFKVYQLMETFHNVMEWESEGKLGKDSKAYLLSILYKEERRNAMETLLVMSIQNPQRRSWIVDIFKYWKQLEQ